MTRTVRDAALMLRAIAGHDERDITSVQLPVPDYAATLEADARPRIGVARPHFFDDVDAEVAAAVERALGVIGRLASRVRDVALAVDDDRTVFRAERYQAETLRRLRTGADISAADYIEKWQQLQHMRRGASALFADVDLIVTPTVPIPAPSFTELEAHPETLRPRELVMMRNTRPFDIWGTPAVSVPCGTTSAGLPIGLQIAGPIGADAEVLRLAAAFERQQA
jgi:Asp-tRNA(Asn)/Glu-tRNA(Gln) amidotransferase A subunit family amidase